MLTALDNAVADHTPVLMQFWKPHWKQLVLDLTEVKLPDVTDECLASAAAGDGNYACDYAPDVLYKAASAKLAEKNPAAFAFLQKFQLTTEQQKRDRRHTSTATEWTRSPQPRSGSTRTQT